MPKKQNLHIGRIHADWCGHCVSLKKEWETMKHNIQHAFGRSIKNVDLEYYDFEDSEARKQKGHFIENELKDYNMKFLPNSEEKVALQGGFPTLFKLLDGKLEYFEGNRQANDMMSWYLQGTKQKGGKRSRKKHVKSKKNKKRFNRSTRKTNIFRWF